MTPTQPASRKIAKIWDVHMRDVSPVHRAGPVLQPGRWTEYDPFLLMMEDQFGKGAFDVHPHRGFETVTYIIDGRLEHYDNATGTGGILEKGDVQWMTAGRGVVHLESPPEGETVHTLQLWVNLPGRFKMAEPRYQHLPAAEMPVREEDGARIRVFSGSSGPVAAATLNYTPVTFVEMELDPGASIAQDLPAGYNGYIYVLAGSGTFGANQVAARQGQALQIGTADLSDAPNAAAVPTEIRVTADAGAPLRLVLFAGEPIGEPVAAYGPFVMNTEQEIHQALRDYREGRFLNPSS